jgi:hypothetical protein
LFAGQTLTADEVLQLGNEKEALFRELYRPHLVPVAGLIRFSESLKNGWHPHGRCYVGTGRKPGFCDRRA